MKRGQNFIFNCTDAFESLVDYSKMVQDSQKLNISLIIKSLPSCLKFELGLQLKLSGRSRSSKWGRLAEDLKIRPIVRHFEKLLKEAFYLKNDKHVLSVYTN